MINQDLLFELNTKRLAIANAYRMDETELVRDLLQQTSFSAAVLAQIQQKARKLVVAMRAKRIDQGGMDALMYEYDLSSDEGVALMCLAEALLRIPDNTTIDRLIKDKLGTSNWEQHLGKSASTFVNAATWGLMLTGKILDDQKKSAGYLSNVFKGLIKRSGEPVIRAAVAKAMKILGMQFVMGRTIEEATKRAKAEEAKGYCYSYDMLGEAACNQKDAVHYYQQYEHAIHYLGKNYPGMGPIDGPGISVKLSALHPRYEPLKRQRVLEELLPRLMQLAMLAKEYNIGFTIDAEEAERLDLSLDIIEYLARAPELEGWHGLGLAIQAYQKRGCFVVDWAIELAKVTNHRLMIRLVKGAYWDSEIKWSQVAGLSGFPVFTRKATTDVSYIACVQKLAAAGDVIFPQFATHNAYSAALVMTLMDGKPFEFQCLHGMGEPLYSNIVGRDHYNLPCRIYAPVGSHQHLLAYLVRRLLENGANTSFVNRIANEAAPIEDLIADPITKVAQLTLKPHPNIALPDDLYGSSRPNSKGIDHSHPVELQHVIQAVEKNLANRWHATPSLGASLPAKDVTSPANFNEVIGTVVSSSDEQVERALTIAYQHARAWDQTSPEKRANCLEKMAKLLESSEHRFETLALLMKEGGKTFEDAVAELREAVDFCYYYAQRTRADFYPQVLAGPTGEHNQITLYGRGVIACISPWNFPLAIFLGQLTAALAAGNAVIAKPASQTNLIAYRAVELLYQAGIPKEVLHLLPGGGRSVGQRLISDERIQGVMFTGSTETARHINQTLANREGPIVPFIAETGGLNAMIVDSSALPEQVVADVLRSAFGSAGQRCSALRVLYLQEDVADSMLDMLSGAMQELQIGVPYQFSTDVGPVIDQNAFKELNAHKAMMQAEWKTVAECKLAPELLKQGYFVSPAVFEIDNIQTLGKEVFGPILHVIRYQAKHLKAVIEEINQIGYGLTLGIHSRIQHDVVNVICQHAKVGNIYVNRDMIGAVVGVQPFGGEGLSGTGPKAGGPRYLPRLATERTLCVNTAAAGGNASLMALGDE